MTMSLRTRMKRFLAVAICVTIAVACMFFVEFFVFPDTTAPTPFEDFWFYVWAVASWPLSVVWSRSQQDPPLVVIVLLTIASGLFWAFIAELLSAVKKLYVIGHLAPQPCPTPTERN
jgi:hypothetical protein